MQGLLDTFTLDETGEACMAALEEAVALTVDLHGKHAAVLLAARLCKLYNDAARQCIDTGTRTSRSALMTL